MVGSASGDEIKISGGETQGDNPLTSNNTRQSSQMKISNSTDLSEKLNRREVAHMVKALGYHANEVGRIWKMLNSQFGCGDNA